MGSPRIAFVVLSGLLAVASSGCALFKKRTSEDPNSAIMAASQKPLPPEKTKQLLGEVGNNWLYGQGMGETILNIGTAIVFPPYLIYLLGNAALTVGGYEPITVSGSLPDEAGQQWKSVYDTVTQAPGKVTAAIAGEEFRSQELAKGRLNEIVAEDPRASRDPRHTEKSIMGETMSGERLQ